jgi:hypothetical protein
MKKIFLALLLVVLQNTFIKAQIEVFCNDSITYAPLTQQKDGFLFSVGYDSLIFKIQKIINKYKFEQSQLHNKRILFSLEIDSNGIIKKIGIDENWTNNNEVAVEIQNLIVGLQPLNPLYIIDKEKNTKEMIDFFYINFHFYNKENLKIFFDY